MRGMEIKKRKKSGNTKDRRVNVPLGGAADLLFEQAQVAGTTRTNLARLLIIDGLHLLKAGKISVRMPGLEVNP